MPRVKLTVEGWTEKVEPLDLGLANLTEIIGIVVDRWPGMEQTEPCFYELLKDGDVPAFEEMCEQLPAALCERYVLRDSSDYYGEAVLEVLYPAVTGLPLSAASEEELERWRKGIGSALSHATRTSWKPKES